MPNKERMLQVFHISKLQSSGETTPDKRFTLVEAECLGACGYAPMLQCGDEYFENLDEAKVDRLLEELK
jgi:NADH-quinone oxidoreductase subunit E